MSKSYQWSLDHLYTSFEDPNLKKDYETILLQAEQFSHFANDDFYKNTEPKLIIETYLNGENIIGEGITKISAFAALSQSTEAKNPHAQKWIDRMRQVGTSLTGPRVTFLYWLQDKREQLEKMETESELIKAHSFALRERIQNSCHLLSREEEALISAMVQTGSSPWEGLQNKTTSLMMIPISIEGEMKTLPLSSIRNLAYDPRPEVRRAAYQAELEAYPKYMDISAAALNAIKGEVITLAELKKYQDPLSMSLENSRMDPSILDTLLTAMEEALPMFRDYMKGKAKLLGHSGALPFYDIFAPVGSSDRRFHIEDCQMVVEEAFRSFSDELGDFAHLAFEESWVDFEPRQGKRGGAFCHSIYGIKESRILCNYQGSMNNIITVAHELGHGFHGRHIFKESLLNASYPMPLAETASTFCETIVKNKLMSEATPEEKLLLLETSIQGYNQIIVDIYARFLFEKAVFEDRKKASLSSEQLCQLMLEAQKTAYGDGIDHETLHPYMWMNKVHYYYASRNFYNFPYAFGLLFAMGLYAKAQTQGTAFASRYNEMLRMTGKMSVKDVGAFMDIDLTDIEFWRASLGIMKSDIDQFLDLIK